MKKPSIFAPVLRIVLPYLLLGAAWILFSDKFLLKVIDDPQRLIELSTAKGWLYVLITGILLYFLVNGEMRRQRTLEANLRESLDEKEALLAELNHRVKNNLQVLVSILNLEAGDISGDEARKLNDRTRARVRSMSLAHERLFDNGKFATLDLGAYLRALWTVLSEIFAAGTARISFDLDDICIGSTEAVPFGLFAAEAIMNAIHYGAGTDGTLDIAINLRSGSDGLFELTIRDKGSGFPESSVGLGFRMMDALAAQLRGSAERWNEGGAAVRLRFPPSSQDCDA